MTRTDPASADVAQTRRAVEQLAERFWAWRARRQPRTLDDIPRLDRPDGWVPSFTAAAVARDREDLIRFRDECRALADAPASVPTQVDRRLLATAIDRVHWELELVQSWCRDPGFYVDQSLGVVFDLLLRPPPFDRRRCEALLGQLTAIPEILEQGRTNLRGNAVGEFTTLTANRLTAADEQLLDAINALRTYVPDDIARQLTEPARAAARAVAAFRDECGALASDLQPTRAIGAEAFQFYLSRVALLPLAARDVIDLGRREFDRAVTLEALVRLRNRDRPRPKPFTDIDSQIAAQARAELDERRFYHDRGLLSVPSDLPRYLTAPCPPYLEPLSWLGVRDELGSLARPDDDAVSYTPDPAGDLGYFDRANTVDPRLGIIHEGAHHQQLALARRNPRPVRRHYYDSCANEGLAFYNEEMLLTAGLLDDHPGAQEYVLNMMRLRALRVDVDVRLALGELSVDEAARLLEQRTPMDRATARQEAAFFAATPGQGLTYQVGKSQVLSFVADALLDGNDMRRINDYLWKNGNVPIALLRWEFLGDAGALRQAELLAPSSASAAQGPAD
ncbi:DUF885 family protein [Micromonospora sp. NPDC051196]|uniref:DUF885 family protein n=1 Tax=Micromonospora sp. NPDC051196 TaxID=3155281 RepID=UPI003416983A